MLQMSFYYSKMASNSDSALLYLKRAKKGIEYSKKSYALDNRLLLYNNFADVYKSTGRYDLCVKSLKDGLKLADSTKNNQETYMMFYMGIAAAYTSMRNFQQSNYWWNKTAGMMTCMANPDKFNFFNNRGSDLYYAGRYKESLKYLLCIDSLCDATKNMEFEKMFAHVNIADVYIKMNKICIAKKYIAETNSFFSKNKQTMVCDYINTQKININLLDGNIAEAYRIASLYPLHSNEGTDIKMQRYRALSDLYKKTKNYKLYIKNNEQYHHINDSLMDINVKMRCSEMLMSYNHDKKLLNQQILLEQKDTSLNISLIFLVVCVICIVLLGLIVGLILKQRKLRECQFRQRIVELRMENVRNRITPHFIYNALNHECLAQDEGRKIQLNNLVSLLRKGAQMVNNFCTTLEEELKFIDYYIGIESESIGSDFIYNIKVKDGIDVKYVYLPSMIVQIFVENAIKHGLKAKPRIEGKNRSLSIIISRKNNGVLVEVIDNGIGIVDNKLYEHTGINVVRQTIQILNDRNVGKMNYDIENINKNGETGCRSYLFIPDDFKCGI